MISHCKKKNTEKYGTIYIFVWKKFVDADISYTKINITLALFLLLITHKKTIGLNNLSDTFKIQNPEAG